MINSLKYQEELKKVLNDSSINFNDFKDKTILITGATGLIGSFLVDTLMYSNLNIKVIVNSRSITKVQERFKNYLDNSNFDILIGDIKDKIECDSKIDYIIHAASNAYPKLFKEDPVGTMISNFIGLKNVLDYAKENNVKRVLYVSSGEIYGILDNIDSFKETDYGYVDILSPRSSYPEAKRASETLAISYSLEYDLDVVIARLCHTFSPTATPSDNRIASSFLRDGMRGHDIILKSSGKQVRSYCYITDCIKGLLLILNKGEKGNAYNVANPKMVITIKELAMVIAKYTNVNVKFELEESSNDNKMEKAILDSKKLIDLGYKPLYDIDMAIKNNIEILKEVEGMVWNFKD